MILDVVKGKQAHENTIYHCLYMYYFLGMSKAQLAKQFAKSKSTISEWIQKYESRGDVTRMQSMKDLYRKVPVARRQWLLDLYRDEPILYLKEAKRRYLHEFGEEISASTIWRVLHDGGLTWKTLERRAIQISDIEILRYSRELREVPWILENLVFLDEVSFDNRDMFRHHGYAIKGERLIQRGEFNRKARVSMLCFCGMNGFLDIVVTDGTFTRLEFARGCRSPTASFFNPIEVLFGLVKRRAQEFFGQNSTRRPSRVILLEVMQQFMNYPMDDIYRKCGYVGNGIFNPSAGFEREKQLKDMGSHDDEVQ
ncbi:Serine kinase [Irineochytrium annulatum]|nr:Serine kinase [Irineochytrium annulatum]